MRSIGWGLGIWAVAIGYWIFGHPVLEWDTSQMMIGARAAIGCWEQGKGVGCSEANYFGLYQYLIAWPLIALGRNDWEIMTQLSRISVFSIAVMAWLGYRALAKRDRMGGALFLLGLAASEIYRYGQTSFAEGGATLPVLALVWAIRERRAAWLIFAAGFVAALTKDTAAPFLLLLVGLAGYPSLLREMIWGAAGVSLGGLAGVLFNFFRYGSPFNQFYLTDPRYVISDPVLILHQFLGLWASPNAGLVFVAPILLLALIWAVWRRPGVVSFGLLGLWLILTAGLAKWWSPYGWHAWASRLVLPWIPVSLYLLLSAFPDEMNGLARRALSRGWRVVAVGALWLWTWPHLLVIFKEGMDRWLFGTRPDICPGPDCFYSVIWPAARSSVHLFALSSLSQSGIYVVAAVSYAWVLHALTRLVKSRDSASHS